MAIERISNLIKNITSEKLNLSTGTMVNFITEFNRKADATLESIKENILNATQIRTDATGARVENMNCFVRNLQGLKKLKILLKMIYLYYKIML